MNSFLEQPSALENAVKKHFSSQSLAVLPANLLERIMNAISLEQDLRKLKLKLWAALGVLAATLVLLVFAWDVSLQAFAQNPTLKFLSLMFTDFRLIADNWQDYVFSILEALPLGAITFLLSSLLASLILGEYVIKQIKTLRKVSRVIHMRPVA